MLKCCIDYAKHAMRFYSRHLKARSFTNKVAEANWHACDRVIKTYSDRDKDILTYVYGSFDTIEDNVFTMSKTHKIHQKIIWDMMKEVERKVAIERGLWV